MSVKLMVETLEVWRQADRLLNELPQLDPDHETVRLTVARLLSSYAELSATAAMTANASASSRATIDGARTLLRSVRDKLAQD
ncbi:MAG TPA: hypothetical protein VM284_06990 [Candidatus Limnocylindria bacterium]|nr:hypothetical protein [Candidatus Limnocylindria bacterium]